MADDLATATAVAAASCRSKTGGYVEACRTETKAFSNREARNFARKTTANYLLSISEDACFVSHARESLNVLDWPLLTNLRAGAWYAPTGSVDATCYFKSMDGHRNQWDFSIGRLNLHVAHMAADSGGVVLVDCTGNRRKTFPDALSKTVPIWTAVLQSMVATLKVPGTCPETFSDAFLHLRTAEAERPDILKLLPEWVEKLRKNLPEAEAMQLAAALKGRRLRPFWACPTDDLNKLRDELEALKEEHAIVLCVSASKVVAGSTSYIQGAGDDEEAWARQLGLGPARFWLHAEELLELARRAPQEVDAAIKALPGPPDQMDVPTQDTAKVSVADQVVCLSFIGGTGVAVGNFASAAPPRVWDCVDAVLNCGGEEHPEMKGDPRYLHLPAADEKKHDPSKRWWQEVLLPQALRFIARSLQRGEKVLIHCSRGDNRCPAVAAAALAAFFGPGGTGPFHLAKRRLEKADLRRCLVVVQCHHPNCMVPRRIMQFLNLFFVTEDGGWSTWQIAPTEEPLTVPSLLGASRASALAAGQPVADQVLTDQGFALYISGAFFAQSLPLLRQLGVSHIVNVTKAPNVFEGKFAYHQVAIEDDRSANLLQVLDAALEFIHDARTQSYNCCVLVHCREGVSR